LIPALRSWWRV